MKKPPNVTSARVIGPMTIEITWSTGENLYADMTGMDNPPFDVLNDPDFFLLMTTDDWGHGIGWPGGLDISADNLYDLCRRQAGLPTARDFDKWMQRNGLSLATAADTLGMTRRMIAHYRTGSRPIPKVVGLACKAIDLGHA